MVEDAPATVFSQKHDLSSGGRAFAFEELNAKTELPQRRTTGLAEFDRALGGGLVPGFRIGSDPGDLHVRSADSEKPDDCLHRAG